MNVGHDRPSAELPADHDLGFSDVQGWCVYLLYCTNESWYAGATNNLAARFRAHCEGRGAKFTRANPPVAILAAKAFPGQSAALKAEWALDWLRKNGPASNRQFKATGVEIGAKTMQSLVDRGLAYWDKSGCAVLRTQIDKEPHEI